MKTIQTKISLIIIALVAIIFTSCESNSLIGIKGSGAVVSNTISANNIEGVIIEIPANVYITKGVTDGMRINAQQNIFENIETVVKNGVTTIKFKKNVRKMEDISVYLSVETLKEVSLSGTGNVFSNDYFETKETAYVRISGSGNIDIQLDAPEVKLDISGSGDIKLRTITEKISSNISGSGDILLVGESNGPAWFHTSGSGNIKAYDFESNYCSVSISGSGNAKIFTTKTLDVKIAGSGNVYYKGNPSISVDVSGSGKLVNAN